MNALMTFNDRLPAEAVRMLVDQHGLWRVLRAATMAALQHKPRVRLMHVDVLSDHLRRDIGLPPRDGGPADWTPRR